MAIPYNPKDAVQCLPAGIYRAFLKSVSEEKSKSGRDMYVCGWSIVRGDGEMPFRDWVVLPEFTWKLKRMAKAFGAEKEFDKGKFDPMDYIGKSADLELSVESDDEGDQNRIKRWSKPEGAAQKPAKAPVAEHGEVADEDIPF